MRGFEITAIAKFEFEALQASEVRTGKSTLRGAKYGQAHWTGAIP
jgi:hypothetical protein